MWGIKYKFKKKIRINSSNNSVYQPLIYMAQNFKKTDEDKIGENKNDKDKITLHMYI